MSPMIRWLFVASFVCTETLAQCGSDRSPPPGPPPGSFKSFNAGKPDIYYTPGSPPSGMILMALKVMNIDATLKRVDLANKEQMTPEYLKINPQHTVPAMDDDGFTLGESRAILAYLAERSPVGKDIFPKCCRKRAKIDEMLYFDVGRFYPSLTKIYNFSPNIATDDEKKSLDESFAMFEEYLSRNGWAALDQMTIADISLLATVALAETVGYSLASYPKTAEWLVKMKAAVPDYETTNQPNLDTWKALYDASRSS